MFLHKLLYWVLCLYISLISFQSFGADISSEEQPRNTSRKIWSGTEYRWLTWEELHLAIVEYNQNNPGEQINSRSYPFLYTKIPGAPASPWTHYLDFKKRGGWPALLGTLAKHLTWERLIEAIIEYNKTAPKNKQINSKTYKKLRKKIPGAPPWPPNFYPNFKEGGGWPVLLGKTCPKAFSG